MKPLLYAIPCLGLLACGPLPQSYERAHEVFLQEASSLSAPIINGEECSEDFAPTAVAIITEATLDLSVFGGQSSPFRAVSCTGTLIAPDVVLTAAHCLEADLLGGGFIPVVDAKFYVSFQHDLVYLASGADESVMGGGAESLPELPPDAILVKEELKHEGFNIEAFNEFEGGTANFYDIALAFLAESSDRSPAVVVTPEEFSTSADVDVLVDIAGWGQQEQSTGGPFDAPPEGSVGMKICALSFINEIGEHEMQIGNNPASSRKCHGDSGGPSYMDVETTEDYSRRVVGITSHAYDESDCMKGGVDTRVDVWFEWIDSAMSERCAEEASRVWCESKGVIPASWFDAEGEMVLPSAVEDFVLEGGEDDRFEDNNLDADDPGCGCDNAKSAPSNFAFLSLVLGFTLIQRTKR